MIVVDANLLLAAVLPSAVAETAEAVLRRDARWAAPRLWRSEVANALAVQVQHRGLRIDDAVLALRRAADLVRARECDVDMEVVLELSTLSRCTACDCEYVAAAKRLGVPLVTGDVALLRAFPDLAIAPATFAT
jgi:predicted nucleic acid-binding protein